ncbi:hypothetical protein NsoK4_04705 [Nitrosopumilus sp. K4]|uniref:hypothetical protein n=1 Tax=Nitrosopumilus sp. K4 TaxID=2795383 RepID=UPI001BAB8F7A|nr:hypothetical protein [Nitrosopumilus sp. K4]QUC65541.1 hypothetical protein NsoK4_04705 [Nitrosopumilus sp. K4]
MVRVSFKELMQIPAGIKIMKVEHFWDVTVVGKTYYPVWQELYLCETAITYWHVFIFYVLHIS